MLGAVILLPYLLLATAFMVLWREPQVSRSLAVLTMVAAVVVAAVPPFLGGTRALEIAAARFLLDAGLPEPAGQPDRLPMETRLRSAPWFAMHLFAEIVGRWHGRPVTAGELAAVLAASPSDGLAVLLLAFDGDHAVGWAGLRLPGGDLTRLYVRPTARGRGAGTLLVTAVEAAARAWGVAALRLCTRGDLTEAVRLYERHGYRPVPPFTPNDPYVDRWLGKPLR